MYTNLIEYKWSLLTIIPVINEPHKGYILFESTTFQKMMKRL